MEDEEDTIDEETMQVGASMMILYNKYLASIAPEVPGEKPKEWPTFGNFMRWFGEEMEQVISEWEAAPDDQTRT